MRLKNGMSVEITPRSDRAGQLIRGIVSEVLTRAENHPHGILVKLETGEIGRVKRILDGTSDVSVVGSAPKRAETSQTASLQSLIKEGENHKIEFKDRALWSAKFTSEDIKNHRPQSKELHAFGQDTSKYMIARALAGFLNSDGGTLIIGAKENKQEQITEIAGIEIEYAALKDGSQDGYRRMIVDIIKDYFPSGIFNHLNNYFLITFDLIDGRTVCGITASKSDKKVFLRFKEKDYFFIRTDASTRELTGEEVVDYCEKRFARAL